MELEVTRSIEEQLSAFLDGELPPEELTLLVRRLERDEAYRATLARYATIGGVMRSEPLLQGRSGLHKNVLEAISTEHPAIAGQAPDADTAAGGRVASLGNRGWVAVAAMAVLAVAGVYSSGLLSPRVQTPDGRLMSERVPEAAAVAAVSNPASQPPAAVTPAIPAAALVQAAPDDRALNPSAVPVRSPRVQVNRERMRSYLISHGEYARTFHGAMADSRMYVQQASFEE